MIWIQLAGSLAGVVALAAVAWWLGLGRNEPLTEEEARERAEFELMPYRAEAVFVSTDGVVAVVVGEDRRILLLKAHGTQPASRELQRPVEWREDREAIILLTRDRMFGDGRLHLDAAARDRLRAML